MLRIPASRVFSLLALLGLLFLPQSARAQDTLATKTRPKIGLALAGGAALGLAHIGVLEWLEEHRVPVDAVAGTSMGGLVGGFYATGMPPQEMRDILGKFAWDTILNGSVPFKRLGFRRKEDARNIQNRFEIGLKNGFSLPSGINPANTVNLLLSRVALPYANLASFDDLPVPLRVVATDLGTGGAAVLKSGYLDTALRATMAIPALFTPVMRDKTLLTDGAVVENFPTQTAKAMGVDIVIGVDLTTPLTKTDNITSFAGVIGQNIGIAVLANVRESRKYADVIIAPDLAGVGTLDFLRGGEIADLGYKAAEKQKDALLKYAINEADWAVYKAARSARRRGSASDFVPAFVNVQGDADRSIRKQIRQAAGQKLDTAQLERDIARLQGFGRYESFSYTKIKRADGAEGLLVRVGSKSYGPPFANFGIEAARTDSDTSRFTLAARITNYDVFAQNDEVRLDARLGSLTQIGGEYYKRLGNPARGIFTAPRVFYNETQTSLFAGQSRNARYLIRSYGVGADIGYNPDVFREARAGIVLQNLKSSVTTGAFAPQWSGLATSLRLRYVFDGQDSATVPARGIRWETDAEYFLDAPDSSGGFPRIESGVTAFRPILRRTTLFGVIRLGTTFGRAAPLPLQFTLGGPFRLGAFDTDTLRGTRYAYGSVGGLYKLMILPAPIGGAVQVGAFYEVGGVDGLAGGARRRQNVSGILVADTFIGPLLLGFGAGEGGSTNAFFGIGRVF